MTSWNYRIGKLLMPVVGFAWCVAPTVAETQWYQDQPITISLSREIVMNGSGSIFSDAELDQLRKRLDENPVSFSLLDAEVALNPENGQFLLSERLETNRQLIDIAIKLPEESDNELCQKIAQMVRSNSTNYLLGHELLNIVNVLSLLGRHDSTCANVVTELSNQTDALAVRAAEEIRKEHILQSVGEYARESLNRGEYNQELLNALFHREAESALVKNAYGALDQAKQRSDSVQLDAVIRGIRNDLNIAMSVSAPAS
jgi:aminopeptidase N